MAIEQVQEANMAAACLAKVGIDQKGKEQFVREVLEAEGLLEPEISSVQLGTPAPDFNALWASKVVSHAVAAAGAATGLGRLGNGILEAIDSSPGAQLSTARNTLWGAVNGVSYYVDHVRGRSQDTRLFGAWFGQGDQLKRQAVTVGLRMAGKAGGEVLKMS